VKLRTIGWLVVLVGIGIGLAVAAQLSPWATYQEKVDYLVDQFQIERLPAISQDHLPGLSLFFSESVLRGLWEAARQAGGAVTSWEELKGLPGFGEKTLRQLSVFYELEGEIED